MLEIVHRRDHFTPVYRPDFFDFVPREFSAADHGVA
jgi:hypothetical protein